MSTYTEGQTVQFRVAFTDKDGNATDPTAIYATIREPDGTTTEYVYGVDSEVVKESTGVYYVNRLVDTPKRWWHHWRGTGAIAAMDEAVVIVEPSRVVGA